MFFHYLIGKIHLHLHWHDFLYSC